MPNHLSRILIFSVVFSLGFLSGFPAALFSTVLQAWFSQSGYSVLAVSSLGLLNLPFLIRFIWGPVVDKYYIQSMGRRKFWILLIQFLLLICIEGMALGHPQSSYHYLIFMGLMMAFLSSIQDVVIDAHRIEFLPKEWFGFGAVTAVYAYRIALLVSGGLSLIFAEYIGFSLTYALFGVVFLFGMVLVYFSKEPDVAVVHDFQTLEPYRDFFNRPNLIWITGLVITLKCGEVFVSNTSPLMIPFMMKGLGLSLVKIAYVNKIFGLIAQLSGSALAAAFLWRFSILRCVLFFGCLQIISNMAFVYLSFLHYPEWFLWVAIAVENLASGLTSTAMVAFLMCLVNPKFTASQFSLWIGISISPKLLAGPLGGFVYQHSSWTILFCMTTCITACFIGFWWRLRDLKI